MIIRYGALFTVTLRHDFYGDGLCPDLVATPSPASARRLRNYGLVFRPREHGFAVFGELDPTADPPELLRPPDGALVLTVVLRLKDRTFVNITDLSAGEMEGRIYYLNNLRDDTSDGRLFLGDSVDDARLGEPVTLVASRVHRYTPGAAAADLAIEVRDLFGNTRYASSFSFDDAVSEIELDLSRLSGFEHGLYTISDDQGGSERIYFAPELFGSDGFAIIEIFSRTDTLTVDASDQVPAAYRFLSGSQVAAVDYTVGFEARATTRRYVVTKKYDSSTVELNDLTIDGGTFTMTTDTDEVTFESDAPVALSQTGEDYDLHDNGTKLLDLPNPGRSTPLQEGPTPGSYTSEVYLNV